MPLEDAVVGGAHACAAGLIRLKVFDGVLKLARAAQIDIEHASPANALGTYPIKNNYLNQRIVRDTINDEPNDEITSKMKVIGLLKKVVKEQK